MENQRTNKKTAHDSCLLKRSAFCLGVTHPSLCIAELRLFERPLSPPPTSPQPLEIRLLKPKLARRWRCPQDSNPIPSTGHVSILVSRFFRSKHLIHKPVQLITRTSLLAKLDAVCSWRHYWDVPIFSINILVFQLNLKSRTSKQTYIITPTHLEFLQPTSSDFCLFALKHIFYFAKINHSESFPPVSREKWGHASRVLCTSTVGGPFRDPAYGYLWVEHSHGWKEPGKERWNWEDSKDEEYI